MSSKSENTDNDFHVVCVKTEEGFQNLAADWNRLASLTDGRSVFLRHEWFDAAWQWIKHDCTLQIFCVTKVKDVIGICPLVIRKRSYHGIPIRILEPLSVPDTQNWDILADPKCSKFVVAMLMEGLVKLRGGWDGIELDKLSSNSNFMSHLPGLVGASRLGLHYEQHGTNPGIELREDWETYYRRRSRRLKKGNNYVLNRLRQSKMNFQLDWVHNGSLGWDEVSRILSDAIKISSLSWKKKTELTLDYRGPSNFINRLTEHAYRNKWLSIWMLSLDGQPAAMEYQLSYKGNVSALRADYDLSYEDMSLGTYLNWKLLQQLFTSDLQYYSMGPGDNAYKRRWAEDYPPLYRIVGFNNTIRGLMLRLLQSKFKRLVNRTKSLLNQTK